MSYVKTTWVAGDTITADKLNNIEDALESFSNTPSGPTINVPVYAVWYDHGNYVKSNDPIATITTINSAEITIPATVNEVFHFNSDSTIGLGYTQYPWSPTYELPFSATADSEDTPTEWSVILPSFDVTLFNPPDGPNFDCMVIVYNEGLVQ